MVTLSGLESYSAEQRAQARSLSPAFAHYEQLLSQSENSIDPVHAFRHRRWCECVLATFFKTASTSDICAYWSDTADHSVAQVWRECGLNELDVTLFALGKLGARELNLSSDIDLMIVAEPKHALEVEKRLRRFQNRLSFPGEFGFCFRLDFDLRPGGKMGPLITSPSQFQDYYWSQGETWERLALVRLRSIAGSAILGKQISELARRFSFRKFLDFTLLEDLKAMRAQVHQKGFQRRESELHIKLEVGGIRDIELFVHSLLVMNGGKRPDLQTQSTTEALNRLGATNILPPHEAKHLLDAYWNFRHFENSVQAIDDRQTHSLTDFNLSKLSLPTRTQIQKEMASVDGIVSSLLGKIDLAQIHLPQDEPQQKAWLENLGFSNDVVSQTWEQLIRATALSHKNDRDERARQEFLFTFVNSIAKHKHLDRDLGLRLLLDFVKAIRAKATFFSMLLRSPRLIDDFSRLFCLSPYLGSILASRPELMDHFILRVDEAWATDMEKLLQQMSERKLLTELWAANQFLTDQDLSGLFSRISATADEICLQLLSQLRHEFPDSRVKIMALGKWGGEELGLRSDLDFIFVTPSSPRESDFKVARRFISRLTDPLKGGNLYEVDLRLRPSGQSGPLLVAEDSLKHYWMNSAKAWERQAYTRARPLEFQIDSNVLIMKGLSEEEKAELRSIREKLLVRRGDTELDIKYVHGGLIDIEFTAQTALLANKIPSAPASTLGMLDHLNRHSAHWRHSVRLKEIYSRLRAFEQMLQLSSAYKLGTVRREQNDFVKACALMQIESDEGWKEIQKLVMESRDLLNQVDPIGLVL